MISLFMPHLAIESYPEINALHFKNTFNLLVHLKLVKNLLNHGMNLFIASYRFNKPLLELYAATWPFMLVLLIALLLITYVPYLSLWYIT